MNLQLTTQEYSAPTLYEELVRCRKYIDAALERTDSGGRVTHTFQDIVEGVSRGQYQFWPGENACIITEAVEYPQRRGIHFFLAGGDLDELLEMEKSVSTWAKEVGADHVSLTGRPGWKKALKSAGWNSSLILMTKELDDG